MSSKFIYKKKSNRMFQKQFCNKKFYHFHPLKKKLFLPVVYWLSLQRYRIAQIVPLKYGKKANKTGSVKSMPMVKLACWNTTTLAIFNFLSFLFLFNWTQTQVLRFQYGTFSSFCLRKSLQIIRLYKTFNFTLCHSFLIYKQNNDNAYFLNDL